jgi:hypothetical protein
MDKQNVNEKILELFNTLPILYYGSSQKIGIVWKIKGT